MPKIELDDGETELRDQVVYSKSTDQLVVGCFGAEKSDKEEVDVDEYLLDVGEFGRMQILLVGMFCLLIMPPTYQTLIMAFVGSNPPWQCVQPITNKECPFKNSFDIKDEDHYKKRCSMKRSSWEFTKPKEFSIVTEVCQPLLPIS